MSKNHSNTPETLFVGKNVIFLESVASTNSYAKELINKEKPIEGTLVRAYEQTQGRGQVGNTWFAKAGENITASYILYPDFLLPKEQFFMNMMVSLAVRDFVQQFCLEKVFVKWSNDIIVSDKKIAGILIENSLTFSAVTSTVIGIGVNVNQEIFGENLAQATSVSLQNNGQKFDLNELLRFLSASLEKYYFQLRQKQFTQLKETYIKALWRFNELTLFKRNEQVFEAKISDITQEGKLCLDIGEKREAFSFKEIAFVY